MTFKEAADKLETLRCDLIIIEAKMDSCRNMVKSPSYGGIKGTPSGNPVEDKLYYYADLEKQYREKQKAIRNVVEIIEQFLTHLESVKEKTVLHLVYIEQICMAKIGAKIHYSYASVKRFHQQGINNLNGIEIIER